MTKTKPREMKYLMALTALPRNVLDTQEIISFSIIKPNVDLPREIMPSSKAYVTETTLV